MSTSLGHSDTGNVLIDTSVWSLALRHESGNLNSKEKAIVDTLTGFVRLGMVQLLGVVRQEVLSGIREQAVFDRIRVFLRSFDEPRLEIADYEQAAEMSNRCRARGIAGSPVDFLICAVIHRRGWSVLTVDQDFERYRKVLGISLYALP